MNSQLWWYTARASGLVSWALLSASVLWGLALSTKVLRGRPRPNWMLDLHRFLGGTSVLFVGVHLASLLLDSYVEFSPVDLLVPFSTTYQPLALAWGIAGFYLLIAIELTSLLRTRLSKRMWRMVHVSSFPLFAVATIHMLAAGTDASSPITQLAAAAVSASVVGLTIHRIRQARRDTPTTGRRPIDPRPIDLTISEIGATAHQVPSPV